jgi:uncharacterized membrane protein YjfL (UPF0719 family)
VPYFFILPGFALYLLVGSVILVATWLYKPAGWLRPYVQSLLLWSSLSFVVSTVAYAGVMIVSVVVISRLVGDDPSTFGAIVIGALIFIGPFVAAAIGVLAGMVFGLRRVRRSAGRSL